MHDIVLTAAPNTQSCKNSDLSEFITGSWIVYWFIHVVQLWAVEIYSSYILGQQTLLLTMLNTQEVTHIIN